MNNSKYLNHAYFGIVEDINDPKRQGRIRIRVQNVFDGLPLEHLPWSSAYITPNGKQFSVPPVGKIVNVIFDNGSIYSPYYIFTEKYNINLQDKLESLDAYNYSNFNALLFDHRTQVYSETDKLTIDFKLNKMTIDNESINLELKDNAQKITLGSKSADQRVILGDTFMKWFFEFAQLMINPANMVAAGSPVVKPLIDMKLNEFMQNRGTFLSSNVFVVNNSGVDTLQRSTITSEVEHDDLGIVSPNEDFGIQKDGKSSTTTNKSEVDSKGTNSNSDINTSTNIDELSTDKKNIEESNTVSAESKDSIKEKQDAEKKDIEAAKPKIVLKIPIPYMDKHLTIKLSTIFMILGGAALIALAAILFSKMSSKMKKGFPVKVQKFDINEDEINKDLNSIDIKTLNNGKNADGKTVEDKYTITNNKTDDTYKNNKKSNKFKKSPFSYLNRGRTDILESTSVKNRNPQERGNKNNDNYGQYY